MMSYFTAGVLVVLGILLMVFFVKSSKLYIPVGAVCILLGLWWGFSAYLPEDHPVNGWIGVLIKVIAGVCLAALFLVLLFTQKKERAAFKEQQEREEMGDNPPPKRTGLYDKYEDYDYEEQDKD